MEQYLELIEKLAAERRSPAADAEYYRGRAEQELELARAASARGAVSAHYRMACAYLDLIDSFEGSDAEKRAAAMRPAIPLKPVDGARAASLRKLGRRSWPKRRVSG